MAGKGITMTEELRAYLVAHSDPPRSDVHQRLVTATREAAGDLSIMQVAEEQGPWLTFTVASLGAGRAVEVGTFTGYSALCIAEGLSASGRLTCFDISADWVEVGRPFWEEAGVADRIEVVIGPALETLGGLGEEPLDFVFLDADKESYAAYYEMLLPKVRPGGLVVADNTLWSGNVADPEQRDEWTEVIRDYNAMVVADGRVDALLLNVGDGLMVARKR